MFEQYSRYYDLINRKKPYKSEIEFVYNWANNPKSILDLGCGTASYWKYFPEEIFIIGIDKSEGMKKYSPHSNLILTRDIIDIQFIEMKFDCVTALFDVINYIPKHNWWKNIPLKQGGYFIFDLWNKTKVDKEGFSNTVRKNGGIVRRIAAERKEDDKVKLFITVYTDTEVICENHTMYIYSKKDIQKFCGKEFKIVDVKETNTWQTFYKLEKL